MPGPALTVDTLVVKTTHQVEQTLNRLKNVHTKKRSAKPDYVLYAYLRLDCYPNNTAPAVLTLLFENVCIFFDLQCISLKKLSSLLLYFCNSKSARLVVERSSVAAAVYLHARGKSALPGDTPMAFDVQLGHELYDGTFESDLHGTGRALDVALSKVKLHVPLKSGRDEDVLAYLAHAMNVRIVFEKLEERLGQDKCYQLLQISMDRIRMSLGRSDPMGPNDGIPIGFHAEHFHFGSCEVLQAMGCAADTATSRRGESEELEMLCDLLPARWRKKLRAELNRNLIDVAIDVGRPPVAYFRTGKKVILSTGRDDVVTDDEVDDITEVLEEENEGIGEDNRGGIGGTLHRVAVIRRYPSNRVVGMTVRASRHMYGVGTILYDILLSKEHRSKSVLLLGPPGSGKTTMIRDIARLLSDWHRVMIVDSSDEIAGPSTVLHPCVGDARRMSVPSGKNQLTQSLIEAVENHTPDVIVADELSNSSEVNGAATAQARGVRMIASAHGCLRSLVRNGALNGLVGGLEHVTMSDQFIRGEKGALDKIRTVRRGNPIFELVVEMGVVEGDPSACRVVTNSTEAIDHILTQKKYKCQMRRRGAEGEILLKDTSA